MPDSPDTLRGKLLEIKQAGFAVPDGADPLDLALSMMRCIGSTDPELRDNLVHATLSKWIVRGVLVNEHLLQLLEMNLDGDHLFFRVGEQEDDSVFRRSFCVLNVAAILYRHRQHPLLGEDRVRLVKERLLDYYARERDLRGYVGSKGWAHSAAHGADALDELVQCDCMNRQDLLEILRSIKNKVSVDWYTFINEEDERMATAVTSALDRGLLREADVIDWVAEFRIPTETTHPARHAVVTNTKGFLRSLYFRLLDVPAVAPVRDVIRETLSYCR